MNLKNTKSKALYYQLLALFTYFQHIYQNKNIGWSTAIAIARRQKIASSHRTVDELLNETSADDIVHCQTLPTNIPQNKAVKAD